MKTKQNCRLELNEQLRRNQNYFRLVNLGLFKNGILLLIAFLGYFNLHGQMNGWPVSGTGSYTVNSNETWCLDRCHVTGLVSGSGPYTVSYDNYEGTLAVGDWCMMVQMEGTSAGQYTLVEVTTGPSAPSSGNISVNPYSGGGYSNSWLTWTYTGKVQLVKIARFWDLTLNSGVVTCPAYDASKGTGGILAVMVGHDFNLNGGFMNVSKKGFKSTWSGSPTPGAGGMGKNAASSWLSPYVGSAGGHGGNVNSNNYVGYTPSHSLTVLTKYGQPNGPICSNFGSPVTPMYGGDDGLPGGSADNNLNPGNPTTGETTHSSGAASSYASTIVLGASGASGASGGDGAGGGGYGGNGGNSRLNTPVFGGSGGTVGYDGGDAALGGIGGGILYLKVANSYSSVGAAPKRFYAQGSQGGHGEIGGNGGYGGMGGKGGFGGCDGSNLYTPGGWGGFGEGGIGGEGGDGGNGGGGGSVWILKKSGGTHFTFSGFISASAGPGGAGGQGGYTPTYQNTPNARHYTLGSLDNMPCKGDLQACSPIRVCIPSKCDCDELFRHLGSDIGSGITLNTPPGDWSFSKTGQASVYWNKVDKLYYWQTSIVNGTTCSTRIDCKMIHTTQFKDFMDILFAQTALIQGSGSPGIDGAAMSSGKTQLKTGSYMIMEYDPSYHILTDYDDPNEPYVQAGGCGTYYDITHGGYGAGPGGSAGDADEDDVLIQYDQTGGGGGAGSDGGSGNVTEESGVSIPKPLDEGNNRDNLMAKVDLSCSKGQLSIKIDNKLPFYFELNTIDGKFVRRGENNVSQVTVDNVSPGLYYLRILQDSKVKTVKFVVD
ncbi:MAG: T9SS type A sorting domain-containing protein [Bacteroidetes bacterium]|nr:T9SS type A sorting domain-containing protein [Bacteroidota bacterium]